MLSQHSTTMEPVVRRLRSIADDAPDLRLAANVYAAILPLVYGNNSLAAPVQITPAEARLKLEAGRPLLQGEELEFDPWGARELILQLALSLESMSENAQTHKPWLWMRTDRRKKERPIEWAEDREDYALCATSARQIRLLLEQDQLDAGVLLTRVATGDWAFFLALGEDMRLDAGLLWALAQYAAIPPLQAWREQLSPLIPSGVWHRADCPICGAEATLGELQGNDQAKHMRCARCGADWPVRRLCCVHCGNQEHNSLGYLYPDGLREKLRIEVCSLCKKYLKVIATFAPTPPEMLVVEDLATFHLDFIARQRGYKSTSALQD